MNFILRKTVEIKLIKNIFTYKNEQNMKNLDWFFELFKKQKPIIAMAHLPALPGTPRYGKHKGVKHIIEWVRRDVAHLTKAGVDAIMFCNEDDRPYVFEAGLEQVATMSRVIAETKPKDMPFGVDFLWDPVAATAIAHATEASFIREVFTGVFESDMGFWSPNAGKVARFRSQIGADDIKVFYNVVPEFSSPLGSRSPVERACGAVVSSLADAILVSGIRAGEEANISVIKEIKKNVEVPVFVNTGVKPGNVKEYLTVADGAIVGSSLKIDGYTWNEVDPLRVKMLMREADELRSQI
jgi:membrane complex biogenesis BtpA family protein